MQNNNRIHLEKQLCYILRHHPEEFNIVLDENGFASVADIADVLKINKEDVSEISDKSGKKRFEIKEDKIRALYGHSFQKQIPKREVVPPEYLYHGTTTGAMEYIAIEGLKPMKRQHVHLSKDRKTAEEAGKRRDNNPIVLIINAQKAYQEGIKFYEGNENTILADAIPKEHILN